MTALHAVRTARARYACAWDCGSPIRAGQRYVRATIPSRDLPPEMRDPDGPQWQVLRMHGHWRIDCPTFIHGDPEPLAEYAERPDLACRVKNGFVTEDRYCEQHGRAAGWPCRILSSGRAA